jgi:acyl-[acyl-carrier-protein]-phospholipid O-acyltransferase/long-chain-fatty-acid--[acyl-carrier-protein] ligase
MATKLLRARRFLPLFLTQALGALNDNLFKNALVVLVIYRAVPSGPALVALAGGVFILPYAMFASLAGQLADRWDKSRLIRLTKLFELALTVLAAAALLSGSVAALLAVLFGLGVQATFFGPLKYSILPDHLAEAELLRGNALVEAATFAAILAGTIAGGVLIGLPNGPEIVAAAGLAVAAVGLIAAWAIPRAPAAAPSLRVGWNLVAETGRLLREAQGHRDVWLAILGLSWFWTIGATFLAQFPVLAQRELGANNQVITLMLACFVVGIGLGSLLVGRLLRGEVSARPVPLAGVVLSVCTLGFALAVRGITPADGWHDVASMLAAPRADLALACLLGAAASGGVFSVPLYALVQDRAPRSHRARIIAANNVMNAAFMVLGAVVAAGLAALRMPVAGILAVAAVLNLGIALMLCRLLPARIWRAFFRLVFKYLYRVRVSGLEILEQAGPRVVITPNHQSFLDGAFVATFMPDHCGFAVDLQTSKRWWAKLFLVHIEALTVDPANPFAVREMVRVVESGRRLVVFPEGRLTKTGGLMKIYDGAGMVADRTGAAIIPVQIDGLQFTPFGYMDGKLRVRWFPQLSLTVLPPVKLQAPPDLQGRRRRRALADQLYDVLVEAQRATTRVDKTLFTALLDAAATHGGKTSAILGTDYRIMTFGRLILGSAVLGRALARLSRPGETLGVMLPNAGGAVATFFALQSQGRVPAMLNFTAGAEGMLAACTAAGVQTVLSSRAFIEKGKLAAVVARMEQAVRFVWLEDVRAQIGLPARLRGMLDARRARRLPGAQAAPEAPAAVLFTSGSEGAPKGVVLSHRNILSNIAQIAAVVDFSPADRVLNAMPMFHSFGLTGGTLLPLFAGVTVCLYPSPLHYRAVPEQAYGTNATVLFGTDTFLSGWARYAHQYDLRAVRFIFAGAERVREETRRLYADRFGLRLFEGYGVTETAPVLAVNTPMHQRPGTVGRLLPGIEWRLQPVEGIEGGGRLHVRGPNVMLGYLRTDAPGVLQPPEDGWYDTGDIVSIDAQRFVTILGRARRFAKVAGEMVSMAASEALAAAVWPDAAHAVVALPDPRRGEQLLLVTTRADAAPQAMQAAARERGLADMLVPRAVRVIERMPLLGTGKVDYPAVARLVEAVAVPALQEAS